MIKETEIPDDEFEDEEFITYGTQMYNEISPKIKQFLIDYLGNQIYNLESETYRDVEEIIKEEIELSGSSIPGILYRHRTITDSDLWDAALDNFVYTKVIYNWPKKKQWYDRTYEVDDDNFLEEIPESELTDDQKKAKSIVKVANDMFSFHNSFSDFVKQGSEVFFKASHTFFDNTASFDLSILSPEGFEALQEHLEMMIDLLFDKLYGAIQKN